MSSMWKVRGGCRGWNIQKRIHSLNKLQNTSLILTSSTLLLGGCFPPFIIESQNFLFIKIKAEVILAVLSLNSSETQ